MKKSKLFCFLFLFAILLVVSPSLNAQSKYVVTYDRFGPVKIGMTRSQAAKALGVSVTRDAGQ